MNQITGNVRILLTSTNFKYFILFSATLVLLFLCPELLASTGDGDELTPAKEKIMGLIEGDFRMIVAAVAFAFGLVGCAKGWNMIAVASIFGVCIFAAVGPEAIETSVGALI